MRQKATLKSRFRYAILAVLSTPLVAMLTLILFQKTTVLVVLIGFIYGLAAPGILMIYALEKYLPFLSENNYSFIIAISLIPWVILGFLFFTKKEKWTIFVGLFILLYTLYGALALVLVIMGGS